MNERDIPQLAKWPFFVGDLLLLGIAGWIVKQSAGPLGPWPLFFLVACVGLGAWIAVAPFIMEFRGRMKFAESQELNSAVSEIRKMEEVGEQIGGATSQWFVIQENAERAVKEAKSIADRIAEESKAFVEFMQRANDVEKNHLRLEVDKLRRGEGDWLQVLVTLLDHVHALYLAGERSGQENVRRQLGNFQAACREAVRRLGLIPIDVEKGEPFDEQTHQVVEGGAPAEPGSAVSDLIATGYTYQGQLLRKAIVKVASPSVPGAASAAAGATVAPSPATGGTFSEQAPQAETAIPAEAEFTEPDLDEELDPVEDPVEDAVADGAAGEVEEDEGGVVIEGLSPRNRPEEVETGVGAEEFDEVEFEQPVEAEDPTLAAAREEQEELLQWSTEEEIPEKEIPGEETPGEEIPEKSKSRKRK